MKMTENMIDSISSQINAKDIKKYLKGARCTFKDFVCTSDCKFKAGKLLDRKI